ncbi:hypothetical protein Bca101_076665 [Brassica carinata]
MDQNMNDFSESDAPFSFQQLLYGDDWQRWDTYPSVDVNASLLHAMVEMNHGGQTIVEMNHDGQTMVERTMMVRQ